MQTASKSHVVSSKSLQHSEYRGGVCATPSKHMQREGSKHGRVGGKHTFV